MTNWNTNNWNTNNWNTNNWNNENKYLKQQYEIVFKMIGNEYDATSNSCQEFCIKYLNRHKVSSYKYNSGNNYFILLFWIPY